MRKATATDDPHLTHPIPSALALLGVTPEALRARPRPEEAQRHVARLREFRNHADEWLLPIERPATLRGIDAQLTALDAELREFRRVPIDPLREVLQWRNAEGFPVLAPFSVTSDQFSLTVRPRNSGFPREIKPWLPAPLHDCYEDVFALLENRPRRGGVELQASVRFTGTIPPDVRQTIQRAQQRFKDIRIVAEVDRWQIEEHQLPSLREDPLVIGYDGTEFWLLATFDLTPLEEAVRQICSGTMRAM